MKSEIKFYFSVALILTFFFAGHYLFSESADLLYNKTKQKISIANSPSNYVVIGLMSVMIVILVMFAINIL